MAKLSLKDVKKENRKNILQVICEEKNISRTEIAEKTQLSNSTVSIIVSDLLEEKIIIEAGEEASTGGRKRKALCLNSEYGKIAILQVESQQSILKIFDMNLNVEVSHVIGEHGMTGNDLLVKMTAGIFEHFEKTNILKNSLKGIGILFEQEYLANEYMVTYNTSLSSANIPLATALTTQFRVPVIEEFSTIQASITAKQLDAKSVSQKNSIYLHIGEKIWASIFMQGNKILVGDGGDTVDLTALALEQNMEMLVSAPMRENSFSTKESIAKKIASLISPLCLWFLIQEIVVECEPEFEYFLHDFWGNLQATLDKKRIPKLRRIDIQKQDIGEILARRVQIQILLS